MSKKKLELGWTKAIKKARSSFGYAVIKHLGKDRRVKNG